MNEIDFTSENMPDDNKKNINSNSSSSTINSSSSSASALPTSRMELISENVAKVQMLETLDQNGTLVILSNDDNNNGNPLHRPVYSFKSRVNWKRTSLEVLNNVPRFGIYFCSLNWIFKRQLYRKIKDGAIYLESMAPVLHCVCKEPNDFCHGRIGPIDKLIPYEHHQQPKVNGIWISVFGNETNVADINDEWNQSFHRMKSLNSNFNRLIFLVANHAACVGIHFWNTKKDEKKLRIKQGRKSYHHERPLILPGGFYVLEGLFEAKFLNYDPKIGSKTMITPNTFHSSINSPRMIILSEGTHMIKVKPYEGLIMDLVTMDIGEQAIVNNKNNLPNKNNDDVKKLVAIVPQTVDDNNVETNDKARKIEVWLDFYYKKLIMIDYNRIMMDLFKISTINT